MIYIENIIIEILKSTYDFIWNDSLNLYFCCINDIKCLIL